MDQIEVKSGYGRAVQDRTDAAHNNKFYPVFHKCPEDGKEVRFGRCHHAAS